MQLANSPVIAIVGPTASGKSSLAIEIACSYGGEVVSADSMQIYKGMDIGTAKVPPEEREVAHHGLDLVDPEEPYSAALFQKYVRGVFNDLENRGVVPVMCGGTGFYVRAAIDHYEFAPGEQTGNSVRDRYNEMLEQTSPETVWRVLRDKDPESAAVIHPNDSKRVVRALELFESGIRYADQLEKLHTIEQEVPAVLIGIRVDRNILYDRIGERVDSMRERGLIDEVEGLIHSGFHDAVTANQAIGYKEIVWALEGRISIDEAFDLIKQATRRYAKRQMTWFSRDERINWIDGDSGTVPDLVHQADNILLERGFRRIS